MSEREPRFAAFGAGGDSLGARRKRRALQLSVVALVVISGGLLFSEQYLRHDQVETLYNAALSMHDASARPMLRSAVLQDAASERPNPKYLFALAEREENDKVLETYARAFALNPRNPTLALRYGVRLYQEGNYADSRDRFLDAALGEPDNALPSYLEAASIAALGERREDLEEALALVARVNGAAKPIRFPQPLWVQDLPRQGNVHAHLQRRVVEECLAPLLDLTLRTRRLVEEELAEGRGLTWATGLAALEEMGRNLLFAEPSGGLQAMRGAGIQLEALRLQESLTQLDGGVPVEALLSRRLRLEEQVRPQLEAFEDTRDARIQQSIRAYALPLRMTFEWLLLTGCAVALAFLVALPSRGIKAYWTIPMSRLPVIVALGGFAAMLLLYLCLALLAASGTSPDAWESAAIGIWRLLAVAFIAFAAIHPAFTLPSVAEVTHDLQGSADHDLAVRRAAEERRRAHTVLAYRYLGIMTCCLLCCICLWGIGHRIATAYYPHQIEVLATGLEGEEATMMERVQGMLSR